MLVLRRKNFGEEKVTAPPKPIDYTNLVQQALPVVTSLFDKSAAEDIEVLKAKIANAQSWADRMPGILGDVYRNRVRTLKAKLRAAKAKAKLEAETQQSDREWRTVGKGVAISGIVVGGAATILLLMGARYLARKA